MKWKRLRSRPKSTPREGGGEFIRALVALHRDDIATSVELITELRDKVTRLARYEHEAMEALDARLADLDALAAMNELRRRQLEMLEQASELADDGSPEAMKRLAALRPEMERLFVRAEEVRN